VNKEDVIARARKLIQLRDRTTSAGEAQAAAKALAVLLDKHRLEEAEIELGTEPSLSAEGFSVDEKPLASYRRAERWRINLAVVLARHFSVAIWRRSVLGKHSIHMCGRLGDVAMLREMYRWLADDIPRLCANECKGEPFAVRWSWRSGFVLGLTESLAAARSAAVAEHRNAKMAMVLARRAADAEAFLERHLCGTLRASCAQRSGVKADQDAWARGYAAGRARTVGGQFHD
jgi:hypothetical protein